MRPNRVRIRARSTSRSRRLSCSQSSCRDVVLYAHELMVVLRCTQQLLVRLKQFGDLPSVESTTRLGDWYGNILRIGRRQQLLFISERSRLPVVIPIREGKRLGTVFPDAVCEMLAIVGVSAADIADERSRMSEMAFGRTRNRSLLGTLNDFAFMAQSGTLDGPNPSRQRN